MYKEGGGESWGGRGQGVTCERVSGAPAVTGACLRARSMRRRTRRAIAPLSQPNPGNEPSPQPDTDPSPAPGASPVPGVSPAPGASPAPCVDVDVGVGRYGSKSLSKIGRRNLTVT